AEADGDRGADLLAVPEVLLQCRPHRREPLVAVAVHLWLAFRHGALRGPQETRNATLRPGLCRTYRLVGLDGRSEEEEVPGGLAVAVGRVPVVPCLDRQTRLVEAREHTARERGRDPVLLGQHTELGHREAAFADQRWREPHLPHPLLDERP